MNKLIVLLCLVNLCYSLANSIGYEVQLLIQAAYLTRYDKGANYLTQPLIDSFEDNNIQDAVKLFISEDVQKTDFFKKNFPSKIASISEIASSIQDYNKKVFDGMENGDKGKQFKKQNLIQKTFVNVAFNGQRKVFNTAIGEAVKDIIKKKDAKMLSMAEFLMDSIGSARYADSKTIFNKPDCIVRIKTESKSCKDVLNFDDDKKNISFKDGYSLSDINKKASNIGGEIDKSHITLINLVNTSYDLVKLGNSVTC